MANRQAVKETKSKQLWFWRSTTRADLTTGEECIIIAVTNRVLIDHQTRHSGKWCGVVILYQDLFSIIINSIQQSIDYEFLYLKRRERLGVACASSTLLTSSSSDWDKTGQLGLPSWVFLPSLRKGRRPTLLLRFILLSYSERPWVM